MFRFIFSLKFIYANQDIICKCASYELYFVCGNKSDYTNLYPYNINKPIKLFPSGVSNLKMIQCIRKHKIYVSYLPIDITLIQNELRKRVYFMKPKL